MMKVSYKGYEIMVEADPDDPSLEYKSYYIMRESDTWFATDGFEYNGETEAEMIESFKERIDNEHAEDDPWMEHEEEQRYQEGRPSRLTEIMQGGKSGD